MSFGAHSRYYNGVLTQKRLFLMVCATFRSDFHVGWKNQNKHLTLNLSFDTLSKWHEPDINDCYFPSDNLVCHSSQQGVDENENEQSILSYESFYFLQKIDTN